MIWKLFAPNPRSVDVRLFYRDLFKNGKTSKLKELKYFQRPTLKHLIWKTTDIKYSTIAKCLKSISEMKGENNHTNEDIFKTRQYRAIELMVRRQPRSSSILKRQLVLLESYGFDTELEPVVLIIGHIVFKNK